ncbi:MAG: nucleoid-associated protein, partial [Bacteroidales bacterium]|nr:nucleoid-associated protein [Candidatus Colimorpha onthohippi]
MGNKSTDEGYVLSNQLIPITDQLQDILIRYLISPFKGDAFYHFYHEDGVKRNEVFQRVSNIFDNAECILDESASLAQLLYNATEHPNLNGGDFVVVYFDECQLNGETTSAVGLFKSEHTESFLKVAYSDEQFSSDYGEASGKAKVALTVDRGIATDKLD